MVLMLSSASTSYRNEQSDSRSKPHPQWGVNHHYNKDGDESGVIALLKRENDLLRQIIDKWIKQK